MTNVTIKFIPEYEFPEDLLIEDVQKVIYTTHILTVTLNNDSELVSPLHNIFSFRVDKNVEKVWTLEIYVAYLEEAIKNKKRLLLRNEILKPSYTEKDLKIWLNKDFKHNIVFGYKYINSEGKSIERTEILKHAH